MRIAIGTRKGLWTALRRRDSSWAPWFQLALTTSAFRSGICPGEGWSIGDSDTMKTGGLDFTVTRVADDSKPGGKWNNFMVEISNGTGSSYPYQYCNNV
ncbi:MAG: hypothetical protein ACKOW5_14430 [Actinomycetales bacterium]